MRKIIVCALCTLSLFMASSCSDNLDVQQNYGFRVEHLPVPKKLKQGEVAEIRCQLIRDGRWSDATYELRYFQPDGDGELRLNGTQLKPNDLYTIEHETFRLYYTSRSEENQTLDLYFFDNFGNRSTLNFSFNNDNKEVAEESSR